MASLTLTASTWIASRYPSPSESWSAITTGGGNYINDWGILYQSVKLDRTEASPYTENSRLVVSFDTQNIPDNAVINSVTMRLNEVAWYSSDISKYDIKIISTSARPPFGNTSYQTKGGTLYGTVASGSIQNSPNITDIDVVLSSNGDVSKTQPSYFMIVNGWDYTGTSGATIPSSGGVYRSSSIYGDVIELIIDYDVTLDASISGTMEFTSSLSPTVISQASISSEMEFTSVERATVNIAQVVEKTYLYKVYDIDGNYIGVWSDVQEDPSWTQRINEVGSMMTVTFSRSAERRVVGVENILDETDDPLTTESDENLQVVTSTTSTIGTGTDIDLGYQVDLYVYYGTIEQILTENGEILLDENGEDLLAQIGAPNGRRIFTGRIVSYSSVYGAEESIKAKVYSYGYEMSSRILLDGSNTTVSYLSEDPSDIIRDALDKYAGTITYNSGTIEDTGSTVSQDYKLATIHEVADDVLTLTPNDEDWYYYVDLGTNLFHFKQKSATPDHTFVLGRHIERVDIYNSIEDMANTIYFVGEDTGSGNLFKKYTDASAVSTWGAYEQVMTDLRVSSATTAETKSDFVIDHFKSPRYSSVITINSGAYDIETIKLGQSVAFSNFNNFIDNLVLQVVAMEYNGYSVTLTLDYELPQQRRRIEDIERNLKKTDTTNLGTAPA